MNLDEKIARSISAKMGEVVDLFQDTGFDASEILSYLRSLVDQIPLLQDIKMEVKQLQNSLDNPQEKKKDKDPLEEDPTMDLSPSDPELPEMRRRLIDSIKGVNKERQVLRQLLPSPKDPIPDWMKDIPWYDLCSDAYKIYMLSKIMNDDIKNVSEQIVKAINKEQTWSQALHNMTKDDMNKLEEVIRILNSDLEDAIMEKMAELFHLGEDISNDIGSESADIQTEVQSSRDHIETHIDESIHNSESTIIGEISDSSDSISDKLDNISQQNVTCCENQTTGFENTLDSLDQVEGKIDDLDAKLDTIKSPIFYQLNSPSYIHNSQEIIRGLL